MVLILLRNHVVEVEQQDGRAALAGLVMARWRRNSGGLGSLLSGVID